MTYLLLIIGLAAILYGADLLVNGASSIAKKFDISELVIGLTIVAIGTSTPELVVNILSAINGSTDIALGNVLGSNIANILLILGITALINPLMIKRDTQYKEIPIGILAVAILWVCSSDVSIDGGSHNHISRIDGLILLLFFLLFMYYSFNVAKHHEFTEEKPKIHPIWKSLLFIALGITGLYFGGKFFVESAIEIARKLGMSEQLIGLTIVAIGTSIPELATSVVAALKKESDIAVGNVIGSNIINIFLILGVTSVVKDIPVYNYTFVDIAFTLFATLLLFASTFLLGKRIITRTEGAIFLVCYIAYMLYSTGVFV